jgi:hypothetical protein
VQVHLHGDAAAHVAPDPLDFVLLTNMLSPVPGFERLQADFLAEMTGKK